MREATVRLAAALIVLMGLGATVCAQQLEVGDFGPRFETVAVASGSESAISGRRCEQKGAFAVCIYMINDAYKAHVRSGAGDKTIDVVWLSPLQRQSGDRDHFSQVTDLVLAALDPSLKDADRSREISLLISAISPEKQREVKRFPKFTLVVDATAFGLSASFYVRQN